MRVVEVETSWSLVCVLRTVVFVRSPQKLIDHKTKNKKRRWAGREGWEPDSIARGHFR
jgi:hypothetical protein